MFRRIDIEPDFVEFEYMDAGHLCVTCVARPDGISYSQFSGLFEGLKELHDSRQYSLGDYVERQVDTSEIEGLEDRIQDLKEENSVLENELDAAEDANSDLENEVETLKQELKELEKELAEVNYLLESLEK